MVQDIKITPTPISFSGSVATATGTPQLLFRGSGASATDIELNVQSNSDLSFQGTQGELFSITNELQSGTIFAVKDISGLDHISVDASGDVKINKFYGGTFVYNLPASDPGVSGQLWSNSQVLTVSTG